MLYLLLKSGACLAIFMIFYKVALEQQPFHHFKRAYLLGALIVSGIIPFITFTNYVEAVQDPNALNLLMNDASLPYMDFETPLEEPTNYWPFILWSIYGIGVLIFGVKFILNLKTLYTRIQHNEKRKASSFIHVLLHDVLPPHTFFNYIFLNKSKFESNEIPTEVLLHEETHARQKHSIDILFIELLQVVFWFNPLLYIIKRDIKLNHEFLADAQVLKQGISAKHYQNTLLQFSSPEHDCQLANAINYSSTRNAIGVIKKRFTLMKTQSSTQRKWLVGLLIVPLLAGLVYGFSNYETVEIHPTKGAVAEVSNIIKPINIDILENKTIKLNGNLVELERLISKIEPINAHLSKEELREFVSASFVIPNKNYMNIAKEIQQDLREIGIYNSSTAYYDPLKNLNKKAKHSSFYAGLTVEEAEAKKAELFSPENMAKAEESIKNNSNWSFTTGVEYVEEIQNPVTQKELATYNAWAKSINDKMAKVKEGDWNTYPIVKQKDVVKYKSIYDRMTETQRKTAQPWPNFPPPPPPPPAPKEPKGPKVIKQNLPPPPPPPMPKEAKGNLSKHHVNAYNEWVKYLKGKNPHPKYTTKEIYEYYAKMYNAMTDEQKENTEDAPPPPPPPPAPKPKQIAEVETIIEQKPKKASKEVVDRYAKAHPEAVTKAKINGKIEEIVEIPEDQQGTTKILGNSYKYVIKDGVTTWYDEKGKTYTDEAFKAYIRILEKNPKAVSKNKEKGGPNVNVTMANNSSNCLEMPKSFITKNGATLVIKCLENYPDNKLQIFNRWGNLIYSKANYNNDWDGTVEESFASKGSSKPETGKYYFVFESSRLTEQKVGYLLIQNSL